jgi:hypothetical protein
LYAQQWALAFAEVIDIIAARWKLVLYQKPEGGNAEPEPTPTLLMWRDSLGPLSPSQMREGLRLYLCSESGHFEPSPGDIIANAPAEVADRPRLKVNPACPDCHGLGWRQVKSAEGKPLKRVARCECHTVEYQGKTYQAERQLTE